MSIFYYRFRKVFKPKKVSINFLYLFTFLVVFFLILIILFSLATNTKPALAETPLSQLRYFNNRLLYSRIHLTNFNTPIPHYFTIFEDNNKFYIDVFTHSDLEHNHLLKDSDFRGKSEFQYIARYEFNNKLPDLRKWENFKVPKDPDYINYFNENYIKRRYNTTRLLL